MFMHTYDVTSSFSQCAEEIKTEKWKNERKGQRKTRDRNECNGA